MLVFDFVDENKIKTNICSEKNEQKTCIITKDTSGVNQNAVEQIKKYWYQNNYLLGTKTT